MTQKQDDLKKPIFLGFNDEGKKIVIKYVLPSNTTKKDIVHNLTTTTILVGLQNTRPFLEGTLYGQVQVDKSRWTIEQDSSENLQIFCQELRKSNPDVKWEFLISGSRVQKNGVIDTGSIDSTSLLQLGVNTKNLKSCIQAGEMGDIKALKFVGSQYLGNQPQIFPESEIGKVPNLTEARKYFEKGILLKGQSVVCLFNLGLVCEKENDLLSAQKFYTQAAEVESNKNPYRDVNRFFQRASIFYKTGKILERILDEIPSKLTSDEIEDKQREMAYWFFQSADCEIPDACEKVGMMLLEGHPAVSYDPDKALEYFLKARKDKSKSYLPSTKEELESFRLRKLQPDPSITTSTTTATTSTTTATTTTTPTSVTTIGTTTTTTESSKPAQTTIPSPVVPSASPVIFSAASTNTESHAQPTTTTTTKTTTTTASTTTTSTSRTATKTTKPTEPTKKNIKSSNTKKQSTGTGVPAVKEEQIAHNKNGLSGRETTLVKKKRKPQLRRKAAQDNDWSGVIITFLFVVGGGVVAALFLKKRI